MAHLPENAVLVIIDVQQGFDEPYWGPRNNPQAEDQIELLLAGWRRTGRPVVHVQHLSQSPQSPLHPSRPGSALKLAPQDGEMLVQKQVNSAFIGTTLEQDLRAAGYTTLVMVGLTTPHCVSTTTRMAANLGFETTVVADATAAFDIAGPDGRHYSAEDVHQLSLATLHEEFAAVVTTETLLQALAPSGS